MTITPLEYPEVAQEPLTPVSADTILHEIVSLLTGIHHLIGSDAVGGTQSNRVRAIQAIDHAREMAHALEMANFRACLKAGKL